MELAAPISSQSEPNENDNADDVTSSQHDCKDYSYIAVESKGDDNDTTTVDNTVSNHNDMNISAATNQPATNDDTQVPPPAVATSSDNSKDSSGHTPWLTQAVEQASQYAGKLSDKKLMVLYLNNFEKKIAEVFT